MKRNVISALQILVTALLAAFLFYRYLEAARPEAEHRLEQNDSVNEAAGLALAAPIS